MELKVGDTIPNFRAKDTNGIDFDSATVVGHKPLVIYFYSVMTFLYIRKIIVYSFKTLKYNNL